MPHELFSEAEIGSSFGLASETLRHYRERRLIQPVEIATSLYYTAADRVRLQIIAKARQLGFGLGEIEAIIRGHTSEDRAKTSGDANAPPDSEDKATRLARLEQRKSAIQAEIDVLRTALDR